MTKAGVTTFFMAATFMVQSFAAIAGDVDGMLYPSDLRSAAIDE